MSQERSTPRLLGRSTPRIDGSARVTGRAKYAADWRLANMLYSKVVLSEVPHAKVIKVDTSKALKLLGVEAVLTFEDAKVKWSPGDMVNTRYVITDKVRFVGDVIAVIAAKSRKIAEDAAELVKVEYAQLPTVLEVEEALRGEAPKIWDSGNLHRKIEFNKGNFSEALRRCKQTFEASYRTNRVHNTPLEPAASLAWWSGDELTVVAGTQAITTCRQGLAKDLGLPLNKVRVIALYKGGGFGNKNRNMNYDLLAALLAKATGKPVMLEYSRREDFINVHGRWATEQHLKAGVNEDNKLTAFSQKVYCDVGAYSRHPTRYNEASLGYYDCDNVRSEIYAVYTNTSATGNMRSPEALPATFSAESMMDEMSYDLGIDPVEFRLRNKGTTHFEDKYTSYGLDKCIKIGAETIRWKKKWHPSGQGTIVNGKHHGLGMAMCNYHSSMGQGAAIIKVNQDGTVNLAVGVTDIGTGAKSTMGIIAAEALGVDLSDVKVVWGDTDSCPFSIGESGSRTTTFTGMAVKAAAEDAKRQLFGLAAKILDANPDQLSMDGKVIFVKDQSERSISLAKVAETMSDGIIASASINPSLPKGEYRASFAAHFVEVFVDLETGVVDVSRYVAVHDSGPIVNRLTAESQVQGAVVMGIGASLLEELIVNREQGWIDNPSLYTYRVPTQLDIPKTEVIFVETEDPYGPKTLAEVPLTPVAPAIANAVFNATGARLREIPMTPERVLKAITTLRSERS
ncbi:MAG: xanthine dehydrogenase family protein molybdopterin-binding subunit [Thaumarchaeota archaeon]|nr:xanthine dehydrogenase family protein molybdopterin-binding subunit [Nitrososphaerota archaeon]